MSDTVSKQQFNNSNNQNTRPNHHTKSNNSNPTDQQKRSNNHGNKSANPTPLAATPSQNSNQNTKPNNVGHNLKPSSHQKNGQQENKPSSANFSSNSNYKKGTSASIHARKSSTVPSNPNSNIDNLQTIYSGNNGTMDSKNDLAAVTSRLAAQEDHLQAQLQQQLNLGGGGQNRNMFPSRGGALASLGEDAEADNSGKRDAQSSFHRQVGPRFAGNAAFQSAVARHSAAQQQNSAVAQDYRSNFAHQRQLSLQSRFADLGYNMGSGLGSVPNEMDDMTDDGSSSLSSFDYMGGATFDPTRGAKSNDLMSGAAGGFGANPAHRRAGSEMSTLMNGRPLGHMPAASLGGNLHQMPTSTQLLVEQAAIQQQIQMLQLQQQQLQLFHQHAALTQSPNLGSGQPPNFHSYNTGASGHRRIQSHAPHSGPMGSFASNNSVGSGMGNAVTNPQNPNPANLPRGHGRRHSVNVLNKANQNSNIQQESSSGPIMQANPEFSFPNTANANGSQRGLAHPTPYSPPMQSGHFSRPSAQLSDLSPEYLMAGGGLISFNSFAMNGSMSDLADGFGGSATGGRAGHGRTSSNQWRMNGAPGQQVQDLAQAQAQLALLHQYREAVANGGGHHQHKAPPFNGGFNPMSPSFPSGQFGGMSNNQPGNGANQRRALFVNYLPQGALPTLLAHGKIVVGLLRINKRNRSDAWITTEVLDSDIFISGSKDRNRALEGDLVAVELLDPFEVWNIKKDKEDKKRRKEEQSGQAFRKPDKVKDDLEVEGAQLKLIEDEEENEQSPPALAGHVVAIVERSPGQLFSGTLGLLRPSSAATKEKQQAERAHREGGDGARGPEVPARPKIVWFRPTDKRVPLIAIPADQAPSDFWDDGGQESYNNRLFVACIKRWPITSLHPFGTLVEEIGVIGNVEAETQALLKDNLSWATEEFGENALKCLPPLPWSIPEIEYETRRDFRLHRVFTIDPQSAKDLDDAFSINKLDGGLYEVGVHIADVSHFVKLGSALDREARKRGTSVYLVQRAIPMLPPALSEELCSLVPNVERLAFSCVFTMDKEARVIGKWVGRSIIKSCSKLAYADAQQVIDGGQLAAGKVEEHQPSEISEDIKILHGLAQKMRVRRFENGALKVDNVKLHFNFDEHGLPTDANIYEKGEAHQLVEEFMLQANISVAQQIAAGLPEVSMLRRHDKPLERRLAAFAKRAKSIGYDVDVSSAGALHQSMEKIKDEKVKCALEALITKTMYKAKYFCTGMVDIAKYQHYALNVPIYTQFTSPIRRYADLMVHRQLEAVLAKQDKFPVDREAMAKIAQQCNVKKDAAKLAQEQSAHLFLCLLIHDLTMRYGPVVRTATVMGVLDAAFDVIVPEFGIEKRVHVDQMPIEHHAYDEHANSLSIYWKQNVDVLDWLAKNSDDAHVKKLHELATQRAMMEMTSQSQADEAALFEDEDEDDEESGPGAIRRANIEAARTSVQRHRSLYNAALQFEGLQVTPAGHRIQTIKEIMQVPVIVTSDMSKSPPVLKVFSVNPWSNGNNPI